MRKALLVLVICALASPAWAGGGFSLFGAWSEMTDDSQSLGAGVRLSVGGQNWVGDLTWTWLQKQSDVHTFASIRGRDSGHPDRSRHPVSLQPLGLLNPYIGAGVTFFYNDRQYRDAESKFPGGYGVVGFNFGRASTHSLQKAIYRYGSGRQCR